MCECNRGGALYFDASGAVVFSISDNFCLVLHWCSRVAVSSLIARVSSSSRLSFSPYGEVAPSPFCLSLLSRVASPPIVAVPSSVSRRRSGGNNARAVSQYRAIIYFRIRRAGMYTRRERDRAREGKQNVRQLLNVAGAAPCWVDFAGVVIEDNWEQPSREREKGKLSAHVYMPCMHVCASVRDMAVWQSYTYTLIHARDVYGSVRGGEEIQREKFLGSINTPVVIIYAVLIYINIRPQVSGQRGLGVDVYYWV